MLSLDVTGVGSAAKNRSLQKSRTGWHRGAEWGRGEPSIVDEALGLPACAGPNRGCNGCRQNVISSAGLTDARDCCISNFDDK
ncbi:hypothetical protein [Paracidovorax valerianellae]|uniref:hypothetical protein n=1 Tax=Paracidovorax valerianellae TaxID=187868 RepID=UPI0023035A0A|nr:hypothetical protein [Paracidovorax valerianellae]MDA8446409.1 hypothetical protein [Paracidovorax valerianellae]